MVKGVLLCVILLSCAAIGRSMSNRRRRRHEFLSDILAAMRVLRLRMLNSMEPIGILLRKSDCKLFSSLGNSLWEGAGLAEAWKDMRNASQKSDSGLECLKDVDLRLLDGFFAGLGKTGREEQNNLFATTIAELEEEQLLAKKTYREASRLFTSLGTLVGIGICILIV